MKIHNVEQRSVEWCALRAAVPTASEFNAVVSPLWKVRDSDGVKTYVAQKLAEWWLGGPLVTFNVFDMEQGKVLEEEAVPWWEATHGKTIERVGFITNDSGLVGCSPDGLIGDCGLEIKCPRVDTHVAWLLAGGVPKDHLAQVHGGMYVTGFKRWRFLSYCRRLPAIDIVVERDPKAQEAIGSALGQFYERFEAGKKLMIDANGGPPKRFVQSPVPQPVAEEKIDILP